MKQKEINDLLISWITISFAFAWMGVGIFLQPGGINVFIEQFFIVLLAVGTAFICHELAHRTVAKKFGAHAEFRAWKQGLIFAIVLAFLTNGGFVFAAPGAVYIFGGQINTKRNGLISLAGPAINIFIGIICLGLALQGFFPAITFTVAFVNFFLAAFNMLPFGPLDGTKVFRWNPLIWGAVFIPIALVLFLLF